ncbi:uncharacterized protein [Dysidea avara]|uniref:uncharacterized protein isoform X2 n=1 Tax=Dysidea avara TaxID=196820 RepID=UPI00332D54E0
MKAARHSQPTVLSSTELPKVVTDNKRTTQFPVHPLHAHLSRSSESLNCFTRNRAQPSGLKTAPTKGTSVDYVPTPDVTLGVCHLRVPSTKWDREDVKRISQWKRVDPSLWKGILTDYRDTAQRMFKLLTIWCQEYNGRRKGLVTALRSLHLDKLADQVEHKKYASSPVTHSVVTSSSNPHQALEHSVSITALPHKVYSYQQQDLEKRRCSVPVVLQRQMTQNTLKSLLQLRKDNDVTTSSSSVASSSSPMASSLVTSSGACSHENN